MPPKDRRRHRLHAAFDDEEIKAIRGAQKERGMTTSAWLRMAARKEAGV